MAQDQNSIKRLVGYQAAELIESGMLVGLGTGSTAYFFIERLIQRSREGLSITAVATSDRSAQQAIDGGIKVYDLNDVHQVDITVDGADEIDPQSRMIKGGGGALLREKITAIHSQQLVIIVDPSKCVHELGAFGLPVEIIPFAHLRTIDLLANKGFKGKLRTQSDHKTPYRTDNGNFIIDLQYPELCKSPENDHLTILQTPGVVETGFFINMAHKVIIGHQSRDIEIRTPKTVLSC